ncbi:MULTISPECIES: hypothetical protein [Shouchella]|uniref:Uncharacterized protein n=2 Tax=Shouchella TaxID=2893057 RepID=A0ABY7W7D2_9BACI|nr:MULTISPECIES: hypothetical protein [Shouchella]MED4127690.1 hypothetical protein [Shouchella miscanthi]WDF02625.1 hypothetical protein PQ477_14005 [Shouchella hunanensis]
MAKNKGTGKNNYNDPHEQYLESLLELSEDMIYLGTILSTISSALGFVGVTIARDISRQRDASSSVDEEAQEAATFFSAEAAQTGGLRSPVGDQQEYAMYLYTQMRQMQGELNRVHKEMKKMQEQFNRWHRPSN